MHKQTLFRVSHVMLSCEPCTGMEQRNSVISPPKRNKRDCIRNLVIMRFLCHFWQKEIRGENLKFPHVQHAPSIPLLVPEERAMRRVFTMLGRFHLLLVDVWNIYSTSLTSIPQRLRGTAQGTFIWKNKAMESRTTYLYTGQPP